MSRSRTRKKVGKKSHVRGLHVVALFEGFKGVIVLLVGFGLLSFIHKDIHLSALQLVEHFHLNPARHYPQIFLDLSERVHDAQLWEMAAAATMYFIVRMIEAAGLWMRKTWAEWFAVLTGGMYIPIEIFEAARSVTWPRVTVLLINVGVVSYLLFVLIRDGKKGAR